VIGPIDALHLNGICRQSYESSQMIIPKAEVRFAYQIPLIPY
jgi:hypothetical protein